MSKWHSYEAGYEAGLLGFRIEDDWGGYPSEYTAGWDAGMIMWRRANSYWGA